jgi:hypothetical protein
MQTRQLK